MITRIYERQQDSIHLNEATRIFHNIYQYINNYEEIQEEQNAGIKLEDIEWNETEAFYPNQNSNDWVFNYSVIDNKYRRLLFLFTSDIDRNSSFGKSKSGTPIIAIRGVLDKSNTPFHLTDNLRAFESTIIHETIHFLDDIRYKSKTVKTQYDPDNIDLNEYYNDPIEMNAIYQQFYHLIKKRMNNPQLIKKYNLSVWDGFKQHFIDTNEPMWENYLTDQNKKRFLKRLYSLFKELESED